MSQIPYKIVWTININLIELVSQLQSQKKCPERNTILHIIQDMNNHMIYFQIKVSYGVVRLPSTSKHEFTSPTPGLFIQKKPWCNFYDDHHG